MATGNTRNPEVGAMSKSQESFLKSASRRILQSLTGVYINQEESVQMDLEFPRLKVDSSCDTPNRHPKAPQSSPIDLQNGPDSSVFSTELLECLNKLPAIMRSSENAKDTSPVRSNFYIDDPTRSYSESSTCLKSELALDKSDVFLDNCKTARDTSCSVTVTSSDPIAKKSSGSYPKNGSYSMEKLNLLRVDSVGEFATDFSRRSPLCDEESIIANCASDVSDISLEDVETASSDGYYSCASRERIEFEALAIDCKIKPSIAETFQHWKIHGKRKRALSLDERNPLKLLHCSDSFSKTEFELSI